jgi:1,4-dihydroxy-6-naphthoate synthase
VLIRIGHSSDPDDAFMVWALATGAIDMRGFELELVPADIQTLNEWALAGRLEVTALSAAAYPRVHDRYALLPHGASIGAGYGPIVVTRGAKRPAELRELEIVVPGTLTTAFLVLRLALGGPFAYRTLDFRQILEEVRDGRAEAGLLIHEGQLTYAREGLAKSLDLGEWWSAETGLPLPLGVNVVRRDVERIEELADVIGASIESGLAHRDEALAYARQFGRGLDESLANRFVDMYVNELTQDYGAVGRRAFAELMRRAGAEVEADFVGA